MGMFWNGLYDGHRWTKSEEELEEVPHGCLAVSVHDSDIGIVRYAPGGEAGESICATPSADNTRPADPMPPASSICR